MFLGQLVHSHKKRKDSIEGSPDRVLFAVELEFSKILSTQATSAYIKCKHWMCRKIKTFVFFLWPASWSADISYFCCSGINLFLIYDAWWKLCNIWLFLCENNSRSITIQELNNERKILLQLLLKIVTKIVTQFEKVN